MSEELDGILVLRESNAVQQLNEAWEMDETFLLLPDKAEVDQEWLLARIENLPESHRLGRFCLLTSGSTGEPKIVIGVKERSERLARLLHTAQDSEAVERTVTALPISYSFSFVNQWLWARVHERSFVRTAGLRDPKRLAEVLEISIPTAICLVGAQVPLLNRALGGRRFPSVMRVHFAGGPFPAHSMEFVREMFPSADVYNNYGCAEAMPRLTLRIDVGDEPPNDVGRPLDGVELRIVDDGAIEFRSPFSADGQITESGFEPIRRADWIKSGDIGEVSDRGHLMLLGRNNSVFKRYGEKISMRSQCDSILSRWDGEVAVYRESDVQGEPGHVIVLTPSQEGLDHRSILKMLRQEYSRPHWPIRLEMVESFPTLPNGKEDLEKIRDHPDKEILWSQRI